MGQTMIEKILGAHSQEEASAGKIIWIDLDIRSARDFGGANVVKNFEKYYGDDPLADKEKTIFTFDCVVPANNIPYAQNQHTCRLFARKRKLKLYDVDAGIGSHVAIEEGYAYPGVTFVGTDSHLNILGAVGGFGQGMGDQDIAFAFRTGRTWFEVPPTMKVTVTGKLPENCSAKDLTLYMVRKLGSKGALGRAVEFYGEAIDDLPLHGRITLASMATEMGAIVALLPPNQEVVSFCAERAARRGASFEPYYADQDAEYIQELEFDISELTPQIACPPKPDNVLDVSGLDTIDIDAVFIGSCTNGSYEDIKAVAEMIKGRKVHPRVMAKVAPATRSVYQRLLHEGHIQTLFDAGFIIINAGCGGCASGQVGMTGEGEVQISTSNRNFTGKQGKGDTYLASPETAAVAAVLGRLGKGATQEDFFWGDAK